MWRGDDCEEEEEEYFILMMNLREILIPRIYGIDCVTNCCTILSRLYKTFFVSSLYSFFLPQFQTRSINMQFGSTTNSATADTKDEGKYTWGWMEHKFHGFLLLELGLMHVIV